VGNFDPGLAFLLLDIVLDRQAMAIPARDVYVKFAVEGLLRGDSAARASFYSTMKTAMIMTTNEIRALEDMNPIDGGDELENPATTGQATSEPESTPPPPTEDQNENATALMLSDVADRMVSCERIAHEKRMPKRSEDPERFRVWHEEWMTGHRTRVEKAMRPAWELNGIDNQYRSGMVDNYILARSGAILGNSEDMWKTDAVSRLLTKELKSWKN
jgi:hypothetical protein